MLIINAILDGERDPITLAKLRDERCHCSEEQIALRIGRNVAARTSLRAAAGVRSVPVPSPPDHRVRPAGRSRTGEISQPGGREDLQCQAPQERRKSNDVRFDATGPLFKALGVDLTLIEGIDVGTALVILAEIGVDVSRFPTEKHFASWLRLCPPQNESNKTNRRRGHRKGTSRVTIALRMAARSAGKTMTPLGLFYRRIRSRIGGLGAAKATAHKLACLVYRMLKYGQEYVTQSMDEYQAKVEANMLKALKRKAAAMGFQLTPLPSVGEPTKAVAVWRHACSNAQR